MWEAAAIGGFVLLVRLPFLGPGFGLQPDAWRVGLAARAIRETGRYVPSRYGANPLHELLAALLLDGLPLLLTFASAIGAVFVALAVHRALESAPQAVRILGPMVAVHLPVVFTESVSGKDYLISTALCTWAVVLASERRWAVAGVSLGLAAGFRLPSLIFLPACVFALPLDARRPRAALGLALVAAVVALAALSPALVARGLGILHSEDPAGYDPLRLVFSLPASLGPLAIPLVVLALGRLPKLGPALAEDTASGGVTRGAAAAVATMGLLFLAIPGSSPSSYLVPAAPFSVLLAAGLGVRNRGVWWAAALSGALLGVAGPNQGGAQRPHPSWLSLPLPGGRALLPLRGEIIQQHERRVKEMRLLQRAVERARELPPGAIVVAGPLRPKLAWLAPELLWVYAARPGTGPVYHLTKPAPDGSLPLLPPSSEQEPSAPHAPNDD